MGTWNDKTKFWSETLRIVILAGLSVIGVYYIVDPLKNKTSYKAELDKERLALKSTLIDDFLSKSHKYSAISFDALNGDAKAIDMYQNEVGDAYNNSVNRLSLYFSDNTKIQNFLIDIRSTDSLLYQCFKLNAPKVEWEPIRKKLKAQQLLVAKESLTSLGF